MPPCVFRTIEEGHRGVRKILLMTLEQQLLGPGPDLQYRGQDEITCLPGLHEAFPPEATRKYLSYLLTMDLIRLQADSLFGGLEKGVFGSVVKSRKENPQKLTQLSSRSHPRHLVGKRTAQKDTIIDITSDSQVNSNFPYRWSPASLIFNNYFNLFLYLYITSITTKNNAPHLKSPKNQNRRAALGRPAIKIITGGLQLVFGRPTLALSSALVPQTLSCLVCVEDS